MEKLIPDTFIKIKIDHNSKINSLKYYIFCFVIVCPTGGLQKYIKKF